MCRLKPQSNLFFFFNDTATTEIYTLSLHDALPIFIMEGAEFTENIINGVERMPHDLSHLGDRKAVQQECRDRFRMPSSALKKRMPYAEHTDGWKHPNHKPQHDIRWRLARTMCTATL